MGLSWHKVSASSKTGKLCTTHFICGNPVVSQRLTDPILADVVSRQFGAAYWLITTKLIHMSWSEILPSLVILSLFTFELHVIEIFLPNYVLMLYIRRWLSWFSRQFRAAYWLIATKLIHMSWSEILPSLVILSLFTFELHVIEIFLSNYVLMLYIRQWPSWCHVSSGRHIGWLRPNWYTCPEVKSCQVWLS